MILYRFAYDWERRTFTQGQWLIAAMPFFMPLEAPDELLGYVIASHAWETHLEASSIVFVDDSDPLKVERPDPLPQGTLIGCPFCFHLHPIDKRGWVMPHPGHRRSYNPFNGWDLPCPLPRQIERISSLPASIA